MTDDPFRSGAFAPVLTESSDVLCRVRSGSIPPELVDA